MNLASLLLALALEVIEAVAIVPSVTFYVISLRLQKLHNTQEKEINIIRKLQKKKGEEGLEQRDKRILKLKSSNHGDGNEVFRSEKR